MAAWGERIIPHEFHAIEINWAHLWEVNLDAVSKENEAIWKWHILDKQSGEVNRHGDGQKGCDFTMSAGGCIESCAFMYSVPKEEVWIERALLVMNYYWSRRNPSTNLVPDRPNAGQNRFDGSCFVTSTTGLYCRHLLRAFKYTGKQEFCDHSLSFLIAYGKYGYDQSTKKFWGVSASSVKAL